MIRSHFLNLALFSTLVAIFFAVLTQSENRDRLKVVLILGGSMVVVSLIIAYLMYPFPLR